jgi:hypothetical protein
MSTATTVKARIVSPGKAKPPVIDPANTDVEAIAAAASAAPRNAVLACLGFMVLVSFGDPCRRPDIAA